MTKKKVVSKKAPVKKSRPALKTAPKAPLKNRPDIHSERILILDFGSQYTQLIARRVREAKVYCEIHPCTSLMDLIRNFQP